MSHIENSCGVCGHPTQPFKRYYRDDLSGLPNLFLQGVEMADCENCGNQDLIIPRQLLLDRAVALALLKSPRRMTGSQLRYLRTHVGKTREEFAKYLDLTEGVLVQLEQEQGPIDHATDRLVRLLVPTLDEHLLPDIKSIADHLPNIENASGAEMSILIDVDSLAVTYSPLKIAA